MAGVLAIGWNRSLGIVLGIYYLVGSVPGVLVGLLLTWRLRKRVESGRLHWASLVVGLADLAGVAIVLAGFLPWVELMFPAGLNSGPLDLPLSFLIASTAGLLAALPLFLLSRLVFAIFGEEKFPRPNAPGNGGSDEDRAA